MAKCNAVVQGYGTQEEVIKKCLAYTGADLKPLAFFAVLLIVAGVITIILARKFKDDALNG